MWQFKVKTLQEEGTVSASGQRQNSMPDGFEEQEEDQWDQSKVFGRNSGKKLGQ